MILHKKEEEEEKQIKSIHLSPLRRFRKLHTKAFIHSNKHTDLAPADETSEAGFSRSQESWVSGRLLTDRDELLPNRPVRTFNLAQDSTYFCLYT